MNINNNSYQHWVFTLNNYTEEDVQRLRGVVAEGACRYICFQAEVGENGTPHLQGYVQLEARRRLRTVKRIIGDRAHIENRRGTHAQARDYCRKEESRDPAGPEFVEYGIPTKGAGQRNDLITVKESIDQGLQGLELAEAHFPEWVKYHRSFDKYVGLRKDRQRTWQTHTTVYYGPPGTGKSSRALQEAGPDAFWLSKPDGNTVWWNGYEGQENVVIDEFYGWISRSTMQRLCDRYPVSVETKGSAVPFRAKRIWITSNQAPEDWWRIGLGAMERRLQGDLGKVVYMSDPMPNGWVEPERDAVGGGSAASDPDTQ